MYARQHGVTLVELMIAVGIAAIVVALAVPSFERSSRNNLLSNSAMDLAASLNQARATALKSRDSVSLCPSVNQTDCVNDGNWATGWIMFLDTNDDGSRGNTETIIQVKQAYDSRVTITSGQFTSFMRFRSSGAAATAGSFSLCSGTWHEYSRQVDIAAGGRVSAQKVANLCAGA